MKKAFVQVSYKGHPTHHESSPKFVLGPIKRSGDLFERESNFDFRRHGGKVCVLVHKHQESAGVKDGLQVLFDVYTLGKQSGNEVMYRARETLYVPVDTMCVEKGFPDYRVVAEEKGQHNLIVGEVLATQIRAEAKAFEQQYPAPAALAPRP